MSDVNSAMKESWRCWRADHGGVVWNRDVTSGLWSVSEREQGVRGRVRKWYHGRQGHLGRSEGGSGGRRPFQHLGGSLERVGERLQRAGDTWKEPPVKIHHT